MSEAYSPAGTLTLEDIRAASRGRLTEGQPVEQETEFELGSAYAPRDHEGTGQHADAHDLDNEAFTGQDEKHKGIQADKNAADLSLADEDEGKHDGVGRLGGVFDGLSDSIGIEVRCLKRFSNNLINVSACQRTFAYISGNGSAPR